MTFNPDVMAGTRDASWYANPSGHAHSPRPVKFHVMGGPYVSCCDPHGMLLDDGSMCAAHEVPAHQRCQRPGCKRAWADVPLPDDPRVLAMTGEQGS